MTFLLTGLDIEAKADLVRRQLAPALAGIETVEWHLARTDHEDPDTNERAVARLTVSVKDADAKKIGRPFSNAAVEIALASYPGATMTAPPGEAAPYGVYQPAYIPNSRVEHRVVTQNDERIEVHAEAGARPTPPPPPPPTPVYEAGPTWKMPLGAIAGARSGDKGGNANLGVWVRTDATYAWLASFLDVATFQQLLPETAAFKVERHEFPNLRALNFVIEGILGEGVASSTRQDPQAKGLGEWLRARQVEVPTSLLEHENV
jgi:hypothetical protein